MADDQGTACFGAFLIIYAGYCTQEALPSMKYLHSSTPRLRNKWLTQVSSYSTSAWSHLMPTFNHSTTPLCLRCQDEVTETVHHFLLGNILFSNSMLDAVSTPYPTCSQARRLSNHSCNLSQALADSTQVALTTTRNNN